MKALVVSIVIAAVILALLDWYCVGIVLSRGGWTEWTNYNPFWDVAIAYLIGIHAVAGFMAWAFLDNVIHEN